VKNLPLQNRIEPEPGTFPENFAGCPVILYQGAVNIGRGLEEIIRAMEHLADLRLIIIGDGDIRKELTKLVQDLGVGDRVCLPGRIPFENLAWYTRQATLGISIEQDIGLNYRYALPNKLFDYMQAGLPVLASDLPEIRRVVEDAQFGIIINRFDPAYLSDTIRGMIKDQEKMKRWHQNALKAFPRYTWESQESTLLSLVSGL
jgi:glycosyltransferase involved in cell wall biosynthesis